MEFQKISMENWKRREYFNHYFTQVPCTYSMTVKLDITPIVKEQKKLYPTMLYYIATIVNRHQEFKTALNREGELIVYSQLNPCYTVFHRDTQTFSNIWTEYKENISEFCAAYQADIQLYGNRQSLEGKPNTPENIFNVSMIPWTTFEGFHLNIQGGYNYLPPIFTMGKYYAEDDCIKLPFAMQVHHAVCDGFHTCRFINELQELINS